MGKPLLTDAQWSKIEPLLPRPKPSKNSGRPRAKDRSVMEGILWMLKSGARWEDLPRDRGWPSYSTCRRRLLEWDQQGIWLKLWRAFLGELENVVNLIGPNPLLMAALTQRPRTKLR